MQMRKIKIHEGENYQDGEIVESWSKTRIFAGLIVLVIIVAAAWYGFKKVETKAVNVLGATTIMNESKAAQSEVKLPSSQDANKLLDTAKRELTSLTLDKNSKTASPAALQKIIQDLQSIQKGNGNAMDLVCHTICGK